MKFSLLLLLSVHASTALAQNNNDAYETQRVKINSLLDNRVAKYGQFEQSLSERTGIFGLKTKKDMQRSINLLSDIVETDNNILRETKVLLDYKDFEKSEVQSKASDSEERIAAYMVSITRLQKKNDSLADELAKLGKRNSLMTYAMIALTILTLVVVGRLIFKK